MESEKDEVRALLDDSSFSFSTLADPVHFTRFLCTLQPFSTSALDSL